MLYYRLGNGYDIHLLKAVSSQCFRCHISGNGNHRYGIQIGIGNTGYKVGCSRTGSRNNHSHLSAGSGITVRSMGCPLLMGGKDMMNPILTLIQLIIYL